MINRCNIGGKMYYTIYETINNITGKKYVGKHITENLNDDYLGSGLYLKKSIKKYGKENFKKRILFVFDNEEDMNSKEQELVNKELIEDDSYYNISLGGKGGITVLYEEHPLYQKTCEKLKFSQNNRSQQISEIVKKLHLEKKVGMYGKKQTENQKRIVSEKFKGLKKKPESIVKQINSLRKTLDDPNYIHPNKGKKFDDKRLKKMSEETKNRPKKTCVHCNKTLDGANYAKYHGEKCKLNN